MHTLHATEVECTRLSHVDLGLWTTVRVAVDATEGAKGFGVRVTLWGDGVRQVGV